MEEEFRSESIKDWEGQSFKICKLPEEFNDFYTCLGLNLLFWRKLGDSFVKLEKMGVNNYPDEFKYENKGYPLVNILENLSRNENAILNQAKKIGKKVFNPEENSVILFSLFKNSQDLFNFGKRYHLNLIFFEDKAAMLVTSKHTKNDPILLFKRNVLNNQDGMKEVYSLLIPMAIYNIDDSLDLYSIPFRHSEINFEKNEKIIKKFSKIFVHIDENDDIKIIKIISCLYSITKTNPANFISLGAYLKKFLNGKQICFACNKIYPLSYFPIQCSAHENLFLCYKHFNQPVCLHCKRVLQNTEISKLFNEDCSMCTSSKKVGFHFKVCVECISAFSTDDLECLMNEIGEDEDTIKICSACNTQISKENFEYYSNCYHLVHKSCKEIILECPACYINENDFMKGKRSYDPLNQEI